jgi:hypothetical protein
MMGEQKDGLRARLEERLGPRILRDRMEALRRETGGLLDGRALLALVADEEGLTETNLSTLAGLDPSRPVFARCVVEKVGPAREFQGRDRVGKLRKLEVSDATGSLTVTLWDEETMLVEQLGLRPGTAIRILSAVLKETRFGREIQVGKTGFIVPDEPPAPAGPSRSADLAGLAESPGRVDVRGVILSFDTTGRGRQKATTLRLFDGTGECEVFVPHELLEPPPGLAQGVEIELSAAITAHDGDRVVLRCDSRTALKLI